jgi:hypothetical protein
MESANKRGGRPKKYTTSDDARKANVEGNRRRQQTKASKPQGPADFIAFDPPLHTDIPPDTSANTGLRTDISIPYEPGTQHTETSQIDIPPNLRPISPPPTQLADEDIDTQLNQIRIDERTSNIERNEYEAEIADQLNVIEIEAVEGLIQMAGTQELHQDEGVDSLAPMGRRTTDNTHGLEGDEIYNKESLNSCFPAVSIEEAIVS